MAQLTVPRVIALALAGTAAVLVLTQFDQVKLEFELLVNPPPPSASLPIVFEEQMADHWCWAASADMVVRTLGYSASQCNTAQFRFPHDDCGCQGSTAANYDESPCNQGNWPPFTAMKFTFKKTNRAALSLNQLKYEIGVKGRPVAMTWEYVDSTGKRTGLGHMMVAGGYQQAGPDTKIELYDPDCFRVTAAQPCGWKQVWAYSDYVGGVLGNGTEYLHWDDYYAVVKK